MSQEKDILYHIGMRLKNLRKEHNMTQLDLSVKSDVDRRQIQRIEAGEHDTGITNLYKIARVFDMTVSDFLKFKKQ